MMVEDWSQFIARERQQDYFIDLERFIAGERRSEKNIFPAEQDVYAAFDLTPLDQVKVVILGQDPYHGPDQAHGLCFSVQADVKVPPSLVNIYKELATDIDGFEIPSHGNLASWAKQGVLMLNTVLTVEQGKAHSHAKAGWETFTDHVVELLSAQERPIVFVLWGSHAQKKARALDKDKHHALVGPHPSPLSAYRGFFGCRHFSKVNQLLKQSGYMEINWQV
ncbi:uracil-DNA glycosylase [Shewanella gelidii]|uniref:Uracil-DNA glycosylase n=1 Tax=Shewanella gelidii TaxID=1642821 RepID=A0A917N6A6_9GAMM|nr:uracil-DNA glycosylase [Shewanella gelidii]